MPPPLLSRALDPLLGVFTGVLAYYLYETHPRTAIPEEQRLTSLLKRKYTIWQKQREQKLLGSDEDNIDWQAIAASAEREVEQVPRK
ncbi:hypothetical protein FKP32DRAFT_1591871 [Trametes sanguinea]|nr:hypothetical protein FKP32DRAFT_1591871 [Trametes sanguinea]